MLQSASGRVSLTAHSEERDEVGVLEGRHGLDLKLEEVEGYRPGERIVEGNGKFAVASLRVGGV